jgi:transcriptional regulator with XRE-family HTH domain
MSTASTFGRVLRGYRLAAGFTQAALAERAGISERAISDLERGVKQQPHQDTVELLATALGLEGAAQEAWAHSRGTWAGVEPAIARLPVLLLDGHWEEARRIALQAAGADGIVNQRLFAARTLGPLALHQGEADLAWAQVASVMPDGPETAPGDTWFSTAVVLQRVAAQLALDVGDHEGARAWLEAQDRWLGWSGSIAGRAEAHLGWAGYFRAVGQPDRALTRAREALACATAPRQPLALLAAHRLLGQIASTAGHADAARSHLEAALALADTCAVRYERAHTLLALAELCLANRHWAQARRALDEARGICVPLGAARALAALATLEGRLGAGAAASTYLAG